MPARKFALFLVLVCACRPSVPEGLYACTIDADCPDGLRCDQGSCWRQFIAVDPSSASSGAGPVDPNASMPMAGRAAVGGSGTASDPMLPRAGAAVPIPSAGSAGPVATAGVGAPITTVGAGSAGMQLPAAGTGTPPSMGWAAGEVAIAQRGTACTQTGLLACTDHAVQTRLVCDGSTWIDAQPCADSARCGTVGGVSAGTCLNVDSDCTGKHPGDKTCSGGNRVVTCGPDLTTTVDAMTCPSATPLCKDSACTCSAPCNGVCMDLTMDAQNCGRCGRSCGGTTCMQAACGATIVTQGIYSGHGYAIDDTAIYWFELSQPIALRKTAIATGTTTTLSTQVNAGVAAADGAYVYVNGADSTLVRIPRGGGTPTKLYQEQHYAEAIVLDATSVYFAAADGLYRVPKTGGTLVRLADVAAVTDDTFLALDAKDLYYSIGDNVGYVPITGGVSVLLGTYADAESLALAGGFLYVAHFGGVTRVELSGNTKTDFSKSSLKSILIDGDALFGIASSNVVRVSLATGESHALVMGSKPMYALLLDANNAYWLEWDNSTDRGALGKVAK